MTDGGGGVTLGMPTQEEQFRRLQALVKDSADWGCVLLLGRPGGVAILAPIVPSLVGYEIVAASSDPDVFDVWTMDGEMWQANWNRTQVSTWLAQNTPDEETIKENIVEWAEAAFARYGIPPVDRATAP